MLFAVVKIINEDEQVIHKQKIIPASSHDFNGLADIYKFYFEFAMIRDESKLEVDSNGKEKIL